MKYQEPNYKLVVFEVEDILTSSKEKYEIKQDDDGNGSVIINASNLFR
ncbi:MAG: hypothetical protein II980_05785 [Clostridia bacterium]|nr:hypothetical protein [Clostridia bacterium]